jgi:NADPH2:quinone reductase
MRAYQLTAFGGPDVLELADVNRPEVGPTEVGVEVRATSVNPVDVAVRERGDAWGLDAPLVVGYDVSGVVDTVGEAVERFEPGDEVFYTAELTRWGTYAEYHVERAANVAQKPDRLDHTEAASLPLVACTAWEALVERADVGPGDTVLVHGVGGVGQQAVQLAAGAGARVLARASPETTGLAADLGADLVVDYTDNEPFEEVVAAETDGVDVVLDGVGGSTVARSLAVLTAYGTVVDLVGESGDVAGAAKERNATVEYTSMTRSRATMGGVATLVERGLLDPVVDSVYPFEEAVAAQRRLVEGGLAGKLVVEVVTE